MATREIDTDLDFGGAARVKNLPEPQAPGDAVSEQHLQEALDAYEPDDPGDLTLIFNGGLV